ncbi:DegT/DnrJ/EryC1/StrS family aminotransferase [Prosthecomicrobium hirschii]|uniref:DegT/DnrJ/EryC1/StrS family aminotransferase n=1 Tax=Prosthecodimorpha hirschii TaxID=665126 RepID=UPI0022210C41|nr:DegT/DnrJ/EryC1/StrS aminotransferase family protein [Prosthecomicrobium hirschii]MCW1843781.1 DegT/DnrJ/EryC1/StrS aminotransferase family protein [Prosthecomicrobium hirschii]
MSAYEIPVYKPDLSGQERAYVLDCLESTWISGKGTYLTAFETAFATFAGAKFATAVCNGTVALHLALVALGIGPGDEVIVPTLTYVASANAIVQVGASPVFVDSLPDTWQIDPDDVIRKISPRTRAIMVVHLYGHPCNMDAIVQIARKHGVFVIEDCAEALGTKYNGRHVGTFGDIATFSFFGNKTITTGEGGMVVTNDATLSDRAIRFKGQGLAVHREYWHDVVGYNYRMTNLCAAIGLAQLERIDAFLAAKRRVADGYTARLKGLPVEIHREAPDATHSYWMVSVLTRTAEERDLLRKALSVGKIETRPVFYPVHTMPMYATRFQRHPVAEDIGWRGVTLPSWPGLSDLQLDAICEIIGTFYGRSA